MNFSAIKRLKHQSAVQGPSAAILAFLERVHLAGKATGIEIAPAVLVQ
jgi:hypothetical protein